MLPRRYRSADLQPVLEAVQSIAGCEAAAGPVATLAASELTEIATVGMAALVLEI